MDRATSGGYAPGMATKSGSDPAINVPPPHHKSHDAPMKTPPAQHKSHDAPMKPGKRPGC